MSDEESNQAMGTFATKESVVALETRLQNLEVMLTNLTQHFLDFTNQLFNEDSSEDDKGPVPPENNQGPRQIDYQMKIEIPQFNGIFMIDEFLDWLVEVEKFFDYWGTKEHMKVKLVAYRLKGEFHKLAARVDVRETENQKILRFIDGLHTNIQDEVFKQSHHTLSSAIQLALKIEAQPNKRGTCIQVSSQSSCRQSKPINLAAHDDDIEEEEYPEDDEYEKEDELEEFTYED
ncbi:hypothetical protein WN944_026138 [Citrus x changshan-huyou]|uniref:Uncharacterized protein n=1 Tax=Citrus x changshan-huyou TaxID=2935761 RepID=A0AAP0QE99_9ROSI